MSDESSWRSVGVRGLALFLLCVGVLAVYAPAGGFDFIHDDRQLILRQEKPTSLVEVAAVFREPHWPGLPYYRPVSRSTMVLQKYLHGNDPAPFHRFNIALMCATALVFFGILRRRPFRVRFGPALLAAAIFAVHPVASHTVYPICSGRETLIPSFLMLCALLAYLSPGAIAYWAAVAFTGFSIFSKEQAAVLPGIFVLADVLRLTADPPGSSPSRWIRRYAPLLAVFAFYFAIRSQLFGAALHPLAFLERPLQPLLTLVYTLQTAIVPFVDLVFEPRFVVWWSWPRALLTLIAMAALLYRVLRSGRARISQAAFFAGWWLLALLPTANLLVQEAPFAERYGFFSLVGLVGIVALLASDAWTSAGHRRWIAAVGIGAIAALAWISVGRGPHFANEVAFATEWVRSDPGSYKAQLNRGQGFVETGEWEQASKHLQVASQLRPGSAIIHNGLAYALWRSGDAPTASAHYENAIRLAPDLLDARVSYGELLTQLGDIDRAIEHLEHATRLAPRDATTRRRLGSALRRRGDYELALRQLERSAQLDPASVQTHFELGEVLAALGREEAAIERFEAVLELRPDHVRARARLMRLRRGSSR